LNKNAYRPQLAIYTGLRVSELAGLKWNDVIAIEQVNEKGELEVRYAISIDERFCRGDFGQPKSEASHATIGVTARSSSGSTD